MADFFKTRQDGPNATAANRSVEFDNQQTNISLSSQDEYVNNEPSRVITNMTVNASDQELPKVPEMTRKAIKTEFDDALQQGKTQLVLPVESDQDEVTHKQVAAEVGADYTRKGNTAVIKNTSAEGFNSTSYALKASKAIDAGYSEKEVRDYLSKQGVADEQLSDVFSKASKVSQARQAGYDDDTIVQYLDNQEVKVKESTKQLPNYLTGKTDNEWSGSYWPGVDGNKNRTYKDLTDTKTMSASELVTSLKVLEPNLTSMTTRVSGFFGDQEAAAKAEAGAKSSRQRIIALAAERGLNLEYSERDGTFVANVDGGQIPINESTWDSVVASSGEITGGIAGAAAGASIGAYGGPWGAAAGSIVGAAIGSAAGTQIDYLREAIKLQEGLDSSVMAHKAFTSAEISVVGDVLGFGVFKGGSAVVNSLKRVKDFVLDGNSEGAYKAIKEMNFVTDDEAKDLVSKLANISATPIAGKKSAEQATTAISLTKPGAESLVAAVASVNPQASRAVVESIDKRAKDVLKTTSELSGENMGRIFREDLSNYVQDVKDFYGTVKAQASQSPKSSNFRFDFDKLAIKPVIDSLQKNISDPTILEKFSLQASRIRNMSDSRTFGDLLELRQIVNEFRFNKKITKQKDYETLNKVMSNIDGAITKGAQVAVDNPSKWLTDYAHARKQYASMKQVENNVMYKALTAPGINEQDVVDAASRYITALDGTFNDVMTKLPSKLKTRVENSAINTLANKYTAGVGEGVRAVNFPLLANDLNKVSFTTPEARKMKSALVDMAEVFKNDVPLAQISGSIQVPKFQSYLTADPVVRAKFELASNMFNYVKTLVPNKQQNTLALVRKTSKLLENPLNSKSVKELMEESAGKVDLSDDILKAQQAAARAAANGKDKAAAKVKLYGNGSVLSTNASGGSEHLIPIHRLATTQEARTVADQEGIDFTDTKLLDKILHSRGYLGMQQGTDRVRLFKGK